MSDVPRSLQSCVSTIHTVVLTADVFQLFIKSCTRSFSTDICCMLNIKRRLICCAIYQAPQVSVRCSYVYVGFSRMMSWLYYVRACTCCSLYIRLWSSTYLVCSYTRKKRIYIGFSITAVVLQYHTHIRNKTKKQRRMYRPPLPAHTLASSLARSLALSRRRSFR